LPSARDASDRKTRTAQPDFSAGSRVLEPPSSTAFRPLVAANSNDRPSFGRRALRRFTRFVFAVATGVVVTLAWQSYSETAQQFIASNASQLGLSPLLGSNNPSPGRLASKRRSPPAQEAANANASGEQPTGITLTADAAPTSAPPAPAPELVQKLDNMGGDLATVRETVEQLKAAQEQMLSNIVKLQTAQDDLRRKISAPVARATAPVRRPAQLPIPPQDLSTGASPSAAPSSRRAMRDFG
jgi:cell wall-associated NlpC family hydrolase